ncbi:methyl-accepting chemotaxis protein [Desulfovibrio mangrovi]|uniref:methyl-accepting chemotaxis protein n=1 Tax=Desulfovibrio mangrovi TaxID=2976983 RepID=UPI0022478CB3|nr:methyl-accepting chemotaxis protein [Desulfovibrio mangrovi]UZP66365.1 methyl-accepting chemotaxis protein [Desulfovibrio mangrovi]
MKLRIMHKLLGLSLGITLAVTVSIFFTIEFYMHRGFSEESEKNIRSMKKVVAQHISSSILHTEESAQLLAEDDTLITALASHDAASLRAYLTRHMAEAGLDFATITDDKGIVITRGHSDKSGDSIRNQDTVMRALEGESTGGVVAGSVIPFSIRASTPVRHEGRIIGTISIGKSLSTERFVDNIKAFTDLEVTVFKGDSRLMTTIMKNGKRAVGTRMDNPQVLQTVLEEGQEFLARNTILGNEYRTAYWPILNQMGEPVGMWFIGARMDSLIATENNVTHSSLIVIGGLVPVILLLSWLMARSIAKPIAGTTAFASAVAEGHLDRTLDVHTHDEIGTLADALRTMVVTLKEKIQEAQEESRHAEEETRKAHIAMQQAEEAQRQADKAKREGMLHAAGDLEEIAHSLSSASEELSAQIEQSSNGSKMQSQRTGETAAAMEQMNASVLEVARNAGMAASIARQAKENALSGTQVMEAVLKAIDGVRAHSQELEQGMNNLGSSAEKIGAIMDVISDIADQTNLLALNAAIEAARAGDAGRGFAVVADEVRKLAEKTMLATKEVGQTITGIQQGTKQNINQVASTVTQITSVTERAMQAEQSLSVIASLVDDVSDQVNGIATACEQQSAASEQINHAVEEVNTISGETSTAMHQSAQAVVELASQAQHLKGIISKIQQENS